MTTTREDYCTYLFGNPNGITSQKYMHALSSARNIFYNYTYNGRNYLAYNAGSEVWILKDVTVVDTMANTQYKNMTRISSLRK